MVNYNSTQKRNLQYTSQEDVVSINSVSLFGQVLEEKKKPTIYQHRIQAGSD